MIAQRLHTLALNSLLYKRCSLLVIGLAMELLDLKLYNK
jgi:hypothetical protein